VGKVTKTGDLVEEHTAAADRSPLLPDRHGGELFIADVFDGFPKGDIASMEFPVFSLSTNPDRDIRRFDFPDGHFVEVTPSAKGLATIHDRDVIVYAISQLVTAKNEGKQISRTIRFVAHDMLRFSNRVVSGEGYRGLRQALERLRGTTISTNVKTGGEETFEVFGLIDKARIVSETRDGRMREVEITLSDWLYRSVQNFSVLTYSNRYFRLRKPLERRLYDIGRKMCGEKRVFRIGLVKLKDRCGSRSSLREFRRLVRAIADDDAEHAHIPDYAISINDDDMVQFLNRRVAVEPVKVVELSLDVSAIRLKAATMEAVREIAPGWDKYHLEQEWKMWMADGGLDAPRDADKAFLGFCKKFFERNGHP
jgi:plasmid replication initiation protein